MHSASSLTCARHARSLLLHLVAALTVTTTTTTVTSAQAEPPDRSDHSAVVEQIGTLLRERYVFPDVAEACATHLDAQLSAGAFDDAEDMDELASRLTAALREVSRDKHILVRPRMTPPVPAAGDAARRVHPLDARRRRLEDGRRRNHGVESVSRLEGNIGYLDLRFFAGGPEARQSVAAAMSVLANTDALIFDMRRNTGGYPDMVCFLCSYLFDERTHLNSLYWRQGDRTDEFWTVDVPGPTRPDVPVFVLTSSTTFSGAEEFSYNLRTRDRATLVGETTRGGAHPGGVVPIDEQLEIIVPTGRAINPVTGTNWEGTGVQPHVTVPADDALEAALELASPAADAFRASRATALDTFDPWHVDARRLDDQGDAGAAAQRLTTDLRRAHALGLLHEGDLNQYGYELLGEGRHGLAIAAFALNVELYSDSANVHDSLGEALRAAGRTDEAIASYRRAVELDPDGALGAGARSALRELQERGG